VKIFRKIFSTPFSLFGMLRIPLLVLSLLLCVIATNYSSLEEISYCLDKCSDRKNWIPLNGTNEISLVTSSVTIHLYVPKGDSRTLFRIQGDMNKVKDINVGGPQGGKFIQDVQANEKETVIVIEDIKVTRQIEASNNVIIYFDLGEPIFIHYKLSFELRQEPKEMTFYHTNGEEIESKPDPLAFPYSLHTIETQSTESDNFKLTKGIYIAEGNSTVTLFAGCGLGQFYAIFPSNLESAPIIKYGNCAFEPRRVMNMYLNGLTLKDPVVKESPFNPNGVILSYTQNCHCVLIHVNSSVAKGTQFTFGNAWIIQDPVKKNLTDDYEESSPWDPVPSDAPSDELSPSAVAAIVIMIVLLSVAGLVSGIASFYINKKPTKPKYLKKNRGKK
jgi:hypothetical protein